VTNHRIAYCDPIEHGPLIEEPAGLKNPRTGLVYPMRNGIPVLLPEGAVEGPNARYQRLYDRMAPLYNLATSLYAKWKSGADALRRKNYLDRLELQGATTILEISVGTGSNWPHLNRGLEFYGLDLSAGMLAQCRRRATHLGLQFRLCQGLAEHLPFPSSAFDCVFHVGGINFFTDPAAALREMVRVAKPGTKLLVVDETEELAKKHENDWIGGAFFKNRPRKIAPPVDLLPPDVQDVAVDEIWNRELFVLTFRKL